MGDREADGVERPPAAVSPVTSARHPGAMGSRGRSARRGCHRGHWRTLVATSSDSSPVGVEVPHVCPAVREVRCSNRFTGYGCAARGSRSTGPQPPACARPPRDFGPCCGLTSGGLVLSHTSSCVVIVSTATQPGSSRESPCRHVSAFWSWESSCRRCPSASWELRRRRRTVRVPGQPRCAPRAKSEEAAPTLRSQDPRIPPTAPIFGIATTGGTWT